MTTRGRGRPRQPDGATCTTDSLSRGTTATAAEPGESTERRAEVARADRSGSSSLRRLDGSRCGPRATVLVDRRGRLAGRVDLDPPRQHRPLARGLRPRPGRARHRCASPGPTLRGGLPMDAVDAAAAASTGWPRWCRWCRPCRRRPEPRRERSRAGTRARASTAGSRRCSGDFGCERRCARRADRRARRRSRRRRTVPARSCAPTWAAFRSTGVPVAGRPGRPWRRARRRPARWRVAQEQFTRPGQVDVAYVLPDLAPTSRRPCEARRRRSATTFPVLGAAGPAGRSGCRARRRPCRSTRCSASSRWRSAACSCANTAACRSRRAAASWRSLGALGGSPAHGRAGGTSARWRCSGPSAGGWVLSAAPSWPARSSASLVVFTERFAGMPLSTIVPAGASSPACCSASLLAGGAAADRPARRAARVDVAAELAGRAVRRRRRGLPAWGVVPLIWSIVAAAGAFGCFSAQRNGGLEPWQAGIVGPSASSSPRSARCSPRVAAAPLLLARLAASHLRYASAPLRLAVPQPRRDPRRTGVMAVDRRLRGRHRLRDGELQRLGVTRLDRGEHPARR